MEMQNMSSEESQSTWLKITRKEKILQTIKCQKEKSAEEGSISVIWKLFGNLGKIQHLNNRKAANHSVSLQRCDKGHDDTACCSQNVNFPQVTGEICLQDSV